MAERKEVDLAGYLPAGFTARGPIMVICRQTEDGVVATARHNLGLLTAGYGETEEEALRELGTAAAEQLECFLQRPGQAKSEATQFCFDQLKAAITTAQLSFAFTD
jgi:hypothetical protein